MRDKENITQLEVKLKEDIQQFTLKLKQEKLKKFKKDEKDYKTGKIYTWKMFSHKRREASQSHSY